MTSLCCTVFLLLTIYFVFSVNSHDDMFESEFSKNNQGKYRLQIIEYLLKKNIESQYIIKLTEILLKNGYIDIHSGSFNIIKQYESHYAPTIHSWSCCYTQCRRSENYISGPKGKIKYNMHSRPSGSAFNSNPLVTNLNDCASPERITLNDIISIETNNEVQAHYQHNEYLSSLISTFNHANYIYSEEK
eukprot:246387_1